MIGKALVAPVSPALVLELLAAGSDSGRSIADRDRTGGSGHAPGERGAGSLCPGCGSVLDAPRRCPSSGLRARKCMVCNAWHGTTGAEHPRVAV